MAKVIEYQVNQHNADDDVINCERCESKREAEHCWEVYCAGIGSNDVDYVTMEKVTIYKTLGRIDDSDYEVIRDSSEE